MYDAIVVGARCAGSPTAMLLARKGYQVLLVDRSTFPSDIMSTHFVKVPGVSRLERWGLLDRVAATNCPPITSIALDYGDFALRGFSPPAEGVPSAAYCPRRTVLDKILVDAAVEAGVELREGFTVDEVLRDGDTVTGIRGHARGNGASVTEEARIIIGADGLHSVVARAVDAPRYQEVPALECGYYSYFSGVPAGGVEVYFRDRRIILVFPTNDDQICLVVGAPIDEFHAFRSDIDGYFYRSLDLVPELAERVRGGRREERWVGTADLPNFFRKPYGPGWALVGDAGYHKDPAAGDGISDAFRDAELLTDAIDAGFSGRAPLDDALAAYEQQRNADSQGNYQITLQWASHQPLPPQQRAFLRAVASSPEETNRFFGVGAGVISREEFFSPRNIGRIMAEAARRASA